MMAAPCTSWIYFKKDLLYETYRIQLSLKVIRLLGQEDLEGLLLLVLLFDSYIHQALHIRSPTCEDQGDSEDTLLEKSRK